MQRILIIEPHDDFGGTLADILDAEHVVTRCLFTLDVGAVTEWMPEVLFVAFELLTEDVTVADLRRALPSLRYVVGMSSSRRLPADALGCDRVVLKPFDATKVFHDVEKHLGSGH